MSTVSPGRIAFVRDPSTASGHELVLAMGPASAGVTATQFGGSDVFLFFTNGYLPGHVMETYLGTWVPSIHLRRHQLLLRLN